MTVDTELAAAVNHSPDGDEAPSVIDTTSATIEWKDDGSLAKVNEYTILRDLERGSSTTEVKLCRLTLLDGTNITRNDVNSVRHARGRGSNHLGEGTAKADPGKSIIAGDVDDNSNLYVMKIYDRAKLMRRGSWFARRRQRGPEGVLLPEDAQPPEEFLKVQREIAIMKKLVHPNIVQLVEVIDARLASSLYIVMEYVERGAVMRCIEPERGRYASPITGGCLDGTTAARYFADILAGLEFLHLQLIAHRDLKPENVLLGNDDRAKIADFGVSQYFTDDESRSPKSPHSLARSSSRAQVVRAEGTWCFWAPEMCGARGEDAAFNAYAADAWAAGVTLRCFLYGTVPFFSSKPMDLFMAITSDPTPIPDEADEAVRDILERLLEKSPEKRLTVTEARGHPWIRSRLLYGAAAERDGDQGGFDGNISVVGDEDVLRDRMKSIKVKAAWLSSGIGGSTAASASKEAAVAAGNLPLSRGEE